MMFTHLATAAVFVAVGTDAFLIPPAVSSSEVDIISTLPFEQAVAASERIAEINCPGCLVQALDLLGKPHMLNMENHLQLNFSVTNSETGKLYLNDLLLYPVNTGAWVEPLTAPQVVNIGGKKSITGNPKLGFAARIVRPFPQSDGESDLDLLEVQVEIDQVAGKLVQGIDSVTLKLVETANKKLMIGDMIIIPATTVGVDKSRECTSMACRWRAIITAKLSGMKGCAGKMGPRPTHPNHHPHGGRPRPHGGHRPHHHHRHRHSEFMRFLASIMLHIFIPIAIGVMAGITASVVGMIAGQLIIFIWRALFRRGVRAGRYTALKQRDVAHEHSADETKAFIEHQGQPPVYEEAPAYEEAVSDS